MGYQCYQTATKYIIEIMFVVTTHYYENDGFINIITIPARND